MNLQEKILKRLQETRASKRTQAAAKRFSTRVAMKKAKAKRRGDSTTAAAEAHRMGRMSAESEAAGNPGLAKRQREEGKAAKRGKLKRTSPSTVYDTQADRTARENRILAGKKRADDKKEAVRQARIINRPR